MRLYTHTHTHGYTLEKKQKINKNRIFYLDILRVISCLLVIIAHCSADYVVKDIGSFNFWVGNFFDALAKVSVPIFVMISGALMLDKDYEFNTKKLIKHITKMIIFFIFWSVVYCLLYKILWQIIVKHELVDVISIIDSLIKGHYHLWFIYLIVGLYLIVPLLRLWVKDENKKYVEYFLLLSLIFTYTIPTIINIGSQYSDLFKSLNEIVEKYLQLKYVGGYTTYFILGWYIHNYDIKNKKIVYILSFLGLCVSIFGTYILSATTGKALQMYSFFSLNILFQTLGVFLVIKDRFRNVQNKDNKFIKYVSKYSLGIYAVHVLAITIIDKIVREISFELAIIYIPIVFIFAFALSYLISFTFSKMPILKKVV